MPNSAEKIKAFFSDEQKIKELTGDEKFIKMVSDESATPEDYQEKFKKLGLDLSLEEAEEIHNTVKKIFETPTEKLTDEFLFNVAGGSPNNQNEKSGKGLSPSAKIGEAVGLAVGVGAGAVELLGISFLLVGAACNLKREYYDPGSSARQDLDWKKDYFLDLGAKLATFGGACLYERYLDNH